MKGWLAMSLPTNFFRNNPDIESDTEPYALLPDGDERSKSFEHKDRFDVFENSQKLKKTEDN